MEVHRILGPDFFSVYELKAIKSLGDGDEVQLLNYLKGSGYRVGLLLNFGRASLEYKRRVSRIY